MRNSIAGRQDFDLAVQIFKNAFPSVTNPVEQFRLTQSRLRLEQPILTTSTSLRFPVLSNIQNQGSPYNTEVRLNMQDTFVPTHVGIYVGHPSSATDAAYPLLSYLNPFIFTNDAPMEVIYNGTMKLLINNSQLLVNWPLSWHKKVPQTQGTQAAAADSPLDEFDGSEYGMHPMQPFVLLSGASNIELTVNLPVAPSAADAFSRLIIVFDGVLAQNSTVVQ
jgi:hypothetical protein